MENRACIVQYICNCSERREGRFEYWSDKFHYCVGNRTWMVNAGHEESQSVQGVDNNMVDVISFRQR